MNKNVALGAIAFVAFAAAGFMLLRSEKQEIRLPESYDFLGYCLDCKSEITGNFKTRDYEPYKCPHCAKAAVFQWRYCPDCHRRTIPDLVDLKDGGPKRLPMVPGCSHCKCTNITPYDPNIPEQIPMGDSLPRWP